MTLLYYDPVFMEHQTGDHPEKPARLHPIVRHLAFVGLDSMCGRPKWDAATMQRLALAHDVGYVQSVAKFAAAGGGWMDEDTFASPRSYDVAAMAAGAACQATESVVRGDDTTAFCLSRPPGHHACADKAMGFCLFNNAAVAARTATRELGLDRVLIVDFDVHHGNGTQDIFYDDENVSYFSLHRSPFYPHTGAASETGSRSGLGTTRNLPIKYGTPIKQQLQEFAISLQEFADRIKPQLVIASAGFDCHDDDPIGS